MKFRIGTLFPECFPGSLGVSCLGKALGTRWALEVDNLRHFAVGKHKLVDDKICGGGAGMLIRPDAVDSWLNSFDAKQYRLVYVSPQGPLFSQQVATHFVQDSKPLCILCGRYEGVDCRVVSHWGFEEISIGNFILAGGEVAAMTVIEACVRLIPEVLGNTESIKSESFNNNLLEYDQYTKPNTWSPQNSAKTYRVPPILTSGHHQKVKDWKHTNQNEKTKRNRPDLLKTN